VRRGRVIALALAVSTASASNAFAQAAAGDVALAETLFQEAQKLMKERRYAEACPKFQESQRLDPGGGTLFQLATCHAFTGRTASAWAEFSDVALLAKQRNRPDIERAAREQIRVLEPKLSFLVIQVPTQPPMGRVSVRRDGTVLGAASYGTAMPADPGTHTILAEASGYRSWSTTVEIGDDADRKTVVVPALEKLPEAAAPLPLERSDVPAPAPASRRYSPVLFYTAGGVALAGLGTAAYFGIHSYNKEQEADEKCPNSECIDSTGVDASQAAVRSANIANVAGAFGLVGAGVFVYLWLSNPSESDDKQTTGVRLVPSVAPGTLALGIEGRL
jgi:hypothetical protein